MIAWIFAIVIIAIVGKLIYDVQQKKNKPAKNEYDFEFKDDFQTLAGIKQHNKESAPFNPVNNFLNKNLIEELKKDFQNSDFPKSDESINVRTTKITTIDTNFGSDNDPLASVPMSRVSKKAKQKMAEIAKEDIKITTEARANELISKGLVTIPAQTKPKRKYKKKATK